jgi:hypothetical protein
MGGVKGGVVDAEEWLEKYSPNMYPEQRKFFLEAVKGNRPVGWWREGRRTVMKAIFDYIMDERDVGKGAQNDFG